ncbi:alpha-N-acetylglucosaminidase [Microbacterium tumbae]
MTVTATDGVTAAVALHHYLRAVCGRAVHWDTVLPLPLSSLPDSPALEVTARVREQYYLNYCTFGYTMPFWTWEEWEREIDWMALHGVTMPLAIVGHEAVVHDTLCEFGLSPERAREFLGSPAYVAWAFMGCLESEMPSVDDRWLTERVELGKRIIDRERALGMTPVLPAFSGQIPIELAPDDVTPRSWQGHTTWVIAPEHPLFVTVGATLTRNQIARFGTDHLYASDPFIEMLPVESDPGFPGRVASAILAGLTDADPRARWVLQSWPFADMPEYWTADRVESFLAGVDARRVIMLDLWAEVAPQWSRFDGFFGAEWYWCGLLNFGGRNDPMADLAGAVEAFGAARQASFPPAGLGLTMEATRNNHLFFALVSDLAWYEIEDIDEWVRRFADERYGGPTPAATAWAALSDTVYSTRDLRLHPDDFRGVLTRRPSTWGPAEREMLAGDIRDLVQYDPERLLGAWRTFTELAEDDASLAAGPLGRDLLDTAIAVLSRVADILCVRVIDARGTDAVSAAELLALFGELDRLLACHPEYRFSSWEAAAADAAQSSPQRAAFVGSARQLLTTWNEQPATALDDYAGRIWHGLVGGYYRPRWEAWLRHASRGFPVEGVVALDAELDRLSAQMIARGVPEMPAPPSELGARSRRALERFAPIFLDGIVHTLSVPPATGTRI